MKNTFRNALVTIGSFIFAISIVSAWTGPTGNPPVPNAEAPVNVSLNAQSKLGGLGVGSLISRGAVQIGNTNAVCNVLLQGSVRWTGAAMEYCDGVVWMVFGGGGGANVSFTQVSTGWQVLQNNKTYEVSCPANHVGASCAFDYYDNNGSVYHGYARGTWNAGRTKCSVTVNDVGMTEGQLTAECATGGGGGGGSDTLAGLSCAKDQIAKYDGANWVCASTPKMFSGIATVGYTNGQPHSSVANVNFPVVCNNPVVVAMPGKNASSIACDDGASKVGICANGKTSGSQDLNADVYTITPNGFKTSLSGDSGVCVGVSGAVLGVACAGVSPAYEISWIAMCN